MFTFKTGSSYSFDTHAPAILGNTIKNAVLAGQVDYALANMIEAQDAKYASIAGYLPPGSPTDPRKFTYLVFNTESGSRLVIAYPYINEASIVSSSSSSLSVLIKNADVNDARRVKEILDLAGYHQSTISLVDG